MDSDPHSFQDVDEQMQDNMLYWSTFSPDPFACFINSTSCGATATTATSTTCWEWEDIPYYSPIMSTTVRSSADERLMRCSFIAYSNSRRDSTSTAITWGPKSGNGHRNIHRRMIEYLRTIQTSSPKPEMKVVDINNGSRLFRHMMRERLRREKMSQSYADLYSMLLPRSKADKKSIVQSATVHLKELNKVKEGLHLRNKELRERIEMMTDQDNNNKESVVIRAEEAGVKIIGVRLMNPASTIDSMIGALQCVKGMGAMATTIHSDFSGNEFSAVMTIQTKIEKSEVEKAVEKTLMETERKLRLQQLLRSGGWAHQHFQQDQLNVDNNLLGLGRC